jgi:hypothetical protein
MISMSNPPKPAQPIEDYRDLARLLAEVLGARPDLLARTGNFHTALDGDGARTSADDPDAVQFCALGILARVRANGVANCTQQLHDELAERTGLGSLSLWFEGPETARSCGITGRLDQIPEAQPTEQFIAMLREVAAG